MGNTAVNHMQYPMPVPAGRSTALVPHPQFLPAKKPRRTRREVFEGDAAMIELRHRLAETRRGTMPAFYSGPPRQYRSARAPFRAVLGYAGAVLLAATTAGAAGFVAGHVKLAAKARFAATQSTPRVQPMQPLPPAPVSVSHPAPQKRNLEPAPRALAGDPGPGHRGADLPLPPAQYLTDSAPRLRLGAQLMAAGDVAAARTMFERVAEAGDPAGAFALAETYDPAVLRQMPLRGGGITADATQARHWYEKARDMGSSTAPDRIVRLRTASRK